MCIASTPQQEGAEWPNDKGSPSLLSYAAFRFNRCPLDDFELILRASAWPGHVHEGATHVTPQAKGAPGTCACGGARQLVPTPMMSLASFYWPQRYVQGGNYFKASSRGTSRPGLYN
mmetsp:Transcript_72416/g.172596  ORF Transcript_72416/g.172596 Transcript_72416/m.172596 type:complete len:117 (+) Transcript_72416:621-971(+)